MPLPQVVTPLGRIDLTRLDYFGIIEQVRSIMASDARYKEKFSSFFEGDAGVLLVELFAQIAHLNNLRLDFLANELSWVNAEQQQTILNFLPIIDYRLESVRGSTTQVFASVINQPGNRAPSQILIPARTKLTARNLDGNESIVEILASKTNYTGDVLLAPNIRTYQLNAFAGITDVTEIQVNKPENFTFKLTQTNIIQDSIQIFLQQGPNNFELLEEVPTFISPLLDLPTYIVRHDFDGRATIAFGNEFLGGKFDGIVEGNSSTYKTLRIYYRYLIDDGGSVTNYSPGSIDETLEFFVPNLNTTVEIAFFNQTPGAGGTDILTIDEVRSIAPLSVRTADKAVTNEDYNIILSQNTLVKNVETVTPNDEPAPSIPVFHAHIFVAPNRNNTDFLPTTSPVPDNRLPETVPGETESEYEARFLTALNNFYNLSGMETSASLTSTVNDTVYPIVLNVSDRMRIIVDNDDIVSGYVDIKFTENFSKPVVDIINEINEKFDYPLALLNKDGKIVLQSNVLGDGSFIQLLGNSDSAIDDSILVQTYSLLGFFKNQFDQGSAHTNEALALKEIIDDKKIIGIENRFRPIIATPFRFSARVYVNRNFNLDLVRDQVLETLFDNYSYQSSSMGKSVRPPQVAKLIVDVDGVDYVEFDDFEESLFADRNQIYFLVDEIILDAPAFPNDVFPDLAAKYKIQLNMIRNEGS